VEDAHERGADREALPVADGALRALSIVARMHHVAADAPSLRHKFGLVASDAPTTQDLLLAAKRLGFKAKRSRMTIDRLSLAALPALATLRDGRIVVLAQSDDKRVLSWTRAAASRTPVPRSGPSLPNGWPRSTPSSSTRPHTRSSWAETRSATAGRPHQAGPGVR